LGPSLKGHRARGALFTQILLLFPCSFSWSRASKSGVQSGNGRNTIRTRRTSGGIWHLKRSFSRDKIQQKTSSQSRAAVNRPETGPIPSILRWQNLFEAALFETDLQAIPRRIHLARNAIKSRLEELLCTGEYTETDALINALNVLDDLRRMDLARRRELRRKAEH